MDEDYWQQFRKRARRRASGQMALIIGPLVLSIALIKVLGPHEYPAGDIRNDPSFWLLFALAVLILVGVILVGSIHVLRNE